MVDQRAARMVKESAGFSVETADDEGPAVKTVRAALAEYMKGNAPGYMDNVADNIKFSVLGGIDPVATGDTKEQFMGLKWGELVDVVKFQPYMWCGYKDHMTFMVEWVLTIKKTGHTVQLQAVVHKKTDAEGKICEKWHVIDQHLAKEIMA